MENIIKKTNIYQNLLAIGLMLFFFVPVDASIQIPADGMQDKPPDVIRGGSWSDDFLTTLYAEGKDIDISYGHLSLKLDESLHWIQTWNYHFIPGEFYHTEAVSDSVRLAPSGGGQYFTTGVYTSTVLNAGKPVDWSSSKWTYSPTPESLVVEYRTGDTPVPDNNWSEWEIPAKEFWEYVCVYVIDTDITECESNLSGIDSSQFLQYRLLFYSDSPEHSVAFYDIDILYGIHTLSGTAWSIIVAPEDLLQWEGVLLTSTVPSDTQLTVDILAEDGTVLAQDVDNHTSLANINPHVHPSLRLYATLTTTEPSLSPDIDLWGFRWDVKPLTYLPIIIR